MTTQTRRVPVAMSQRGERIPLDEPRLLVAMGCYDGISGSNHFGANPSVGTTYEIVREAGGLHAWITTATTLELTSSDANDTVAGTGARVVLISGLDANYNEISEQLALDGLTPVLTVNEYLRVNQMQVISAGSGTKNAGDLYLADDAGSHTSGVPDDLTLVEEKIILGTCLSESTIFTVPAGHNLFVHSVLVFMAAGKTVTFQGRVFNATLGTNGIETTLFEGVGQDTEEVIQRGAMPMVPEKASIYMVAKVASQTGQISAAIDGWLVDKTKWLVND